MNVLLKALSLAFFLILQPVAWGMEGDDHDHPHKKKAPSSQFTNTLELLKRTIHTSVLQLQAINRQLNGKNPYDLDTLKHEVEKANTAAENTYTWAGGNDLSEIQDVRRLYADIKKHFESLS